MKKSIIWRNWPVHNLIGHPLSEIGFWIFRPFGKQVARKICNAIHDSTTPTNSH